MFAFTNLGLLVCILHLNPFHDRVVFAALFEFVLATSAAALPVLLLLVFLLGLIPLVLPAAALLVEG
jgi:hypothetical protein